MASLEAPDEFLKNRVMNLPESVVAGTHNTEEGTTCLVKARTVFRTVSSILWGEVVSLTQATSLTLFMPFSKLVRLKV